jgi:2'-5' RNA ligase
MTISSIEARSVDILTEPFLQLHGKIRSGKIMIASVGQFLPCVFYAAPVWNEYLATLSGQIYQQFGEIPETSTSKYYQPGSWLPHVTLAKTLTKEQMQLALQVMQDQFQVFEATVTEIGLAKVNPHEDVERFTL